jgi:dihydrofolate reductase
MMAGMEGSGGENPWAGKKNYVFSNTLKHHGDDYELVRGNIEKEVEKIKAMNGKDIWLFGGASLTSSLLNAGLVDELWLSIHPILLGKGKPLFSGVEKRVQTRLLRSKSYETGLVSLTYEVIH